MFYVLFHTAKLLLKIKINDTFFTEDYTNFAVVLETTKLLP